MPQPFELLGQMPVVEREADVIFDDAQPLGGSIEGGVENANGGGVGHHSIYNRASVARRRGAATHEPKTSSIN
jgi:hypothetical protein